MVYCRSQIDEVKSNCAIKMLVMLKIQSFKLIFVLVSSISLQLKYKILNKTR